MYLHLSISNDSVSTKIYDKRDVFWISFAPIFSLIYCWVLIPALSPCYILIYMFLEMMRWWVGGLSCGQGVCMSWSASGLGVRLVPLGRFRPSSGIFYWPFQGGTSFVDLLCFCTVLCLLCLCARLFVCALWSPSGKGLTSRLLFVVSTQSMSLSHWYPGSGVVLDCIDSWSLHPYLLSSGVG